MSYTEIVDTIETPDGMTFRALIEVDEYPSEPYNDGGTPILRLERSWYGGHRAEQITEITSHVIDSQIEAAFVQFDDEEVWERYMRIFHGTTDVKWWDSRGNGGGDYAYVTFDTKEWRDEMGLTDEYLATKPAGMGLVGMTEWQAYVEGDVYGVIIERRPTVEIEAEPSIRPYRDCDVDRDGWEEIDSCWGHYGTEWAEDAAREELASEVSHWNTNDAQATLFQLA